MSTTEVNKLNLEAEKIIISAIEKLLSVCDRASTLDGHGFNKPDSDFVRSVYAQYQEFDRVSPKQLRALQKILVKYQMQLISFGIDYDSLITVQIVDKPEISQYVKMTLADLEKAKFSEKEWVSRLQKYIQYAPLPTPNSSFWSFYKEQGDLIKAEGYGVSKYRTGEWELVRYSDNDETKVTEEEVVVIPDTIDLYPLYDYQQPHAIKIMNSLQKYNVAIDNSDTGTGKTFTALVVCRELNLRPLVICPKAVIPAWERSASKLGVEVLTIGNYEIIKTGQMRKTKVLTNGKKVKTVVDCPWLNVVKNENRKRFDSKYIMTWELPEDAVVIFDEAHRTKNKGTQNTQLMTTAAEANARILMLSATIGESPLKMFGVAKALRFYSHPAEFYQWARNYNCEKGRFGWEFYGGKQTMERLRTTMKPFMDGMNVDELIESGKFPTNKLIVEAYDMNSDAEHIQRIYDECQEELAELEAKEGRLPPQAVLAIMQKARQKTELYKVPTMVDMTKDFIEEGHSVAIFVNYTATLKKFVEVLTRELQISNIPTIYGENTSQINEQNRLIFQANEIPVIVCNVAAAKEGIDLHDEMKERKRVSLIVPDWNAQNVKQVLGRIHRAGGSHSLQYIIFCADTVEEKVLKKVKAKIENIESLNKGDLALFEFNFEEEV